MTMTDPIADMLTRVRNGNQAYHDSVTMPFSKLKLGVAEILKQEGYITDIAVAGHPEGSPDFGEREAIEALKLKQAFGERTGASMRIVTQFGFDGAAFVRWAEGLRAVGVDLPVHLGVAGPAKVTTLLKYAAACGVGNSLDFFRKRFGSIAMLATSYSPEEVVGPIEQHALRTADSAIRQIHVFPFGGPKKAADWLFGRGSWGVQMQDGTARRFG